MDPALATIQSLLNPSTTTPTNLLREVVRSTRWRREVGGDMPVVFIPEESETECLPSNRMSSFGFLAFVVQSINAVVNVANNINREGPQLGQNLSICLFFLLIILMLVYFIPTESPSQPQQQQ